MSPDAAQPPGFETQVKPMFRERDRESMQSHFDLFRRWAEGGKPR